MDKIIKPFKRLRIRSYRRYAPFMTTYPGFLCAAIDKSSFLSMCDEILGREIYRFRADSSAPYIIDCGANIGLGVAYFKRLYPHAKIVAFEPDPKAYAALAENVKSQKLEGVEMVNKGLGPADGTKAFFSEGADGSRIATAHDRKDTISVELTRLSPYLNQRVDLLKMDIEGSELEVLEECAQALKSVERLFVEYHSLASEPQRLDRILAIMSAAGFRYYIERGGVYSAHPFDRISHHLDYDAQLNIFAYRT